MQSKTDGVCEHEQHKNNVKVEKILKGSLDSILSPSLKIQIMEGKILLSVVNEVFKTKRLLKSPSNVLSYYLK